MTVRSPGSRRWPAPAKINLFLHVIGRRADGYHDLQTLFQFLDLCDEIALAPREDGLVRRVTAQPGVAEEEDLAVRAARLVKAETGWRGGVDIGLRKRIPIGAGLGGGSSDAATVLYALNELWALGLSEDALAELGLALGADVPVFLRGRAAWGEGVGEVLTPVRLGPTWYVVLVPACHVSTAAVFGAPALTRHTPALKIADLSRPDGSAASPSIHVGALLERTRNDCQALVREAYPPVDGALSWLEARGTARMTGTGGAVFAPFVSEAAARACLASGRPPCTAFVARGLDRSPLAGKT